jgi:hypothetical protein
MTTIASGNLKDGDVLLYHGKALLSKIIMTFDGGNYSHAGIFRAGHITEALGDGIDQSAIAASVSNAKFVDVYRFIKDGNPLGGAQYPVAPLDSAIVTFEVNKNAYAYDELLLLALLCSTRQLTAIMRAPALAMVVRNFLDSASEVLADMMSRGKKPVICSEMVFRCFENAGYPLEIRGADIPMAAELDQIVAKATPADAATARQIRAQAEAFLQNYSQAAHPGTGLAASAAVLPVANFVTPHDLQNSPNLQLAGRLSL